MDLKCLANTCKGSRCTRNKINNNYCKIHTTNEICTRCNSDLISSTDSILASSGKSLCVPCRTILGNEAVESMKIYVMEYTMEQRRKHEATMRDYEKQMREILEKTKNLLHTPPRMQQMQQIIDEIF